MTLTEKYTYRRKENEIIESSITRAMCGKVDVEMQRFSPQLRMMEKYVRWGLPRGQSLPLPGGMWWLGWNKGEGEGNVNFYLKLNPKFCDFYFHAVKEGMEWPFRLITPWTSGLAGDTRAESPLVPTSLGPQSDKGSDTNSPQQHS